MLPIISLFSFYSLKKFSTFLIMLSSISLFSVLGKYIDVLGLGILDLFGLVNRSSNCFLDLTCNHLYFFPLQSISMH